MSSSEEDFITQHISSQAAKELWLLRLGKMASGEAAVTHETPLAGLPWVHPGFPKRARACRHTGPLPSARAGAELTGGRVRGCCPPRGIRIHLHLQGIALWPGAGPGAQHAETPSTGRAAGGPGQPASGRHKPPAPPSALPDLPSCETLVLNVRVSLLT